MKKIIITFYSLFVLAGISFAQPQTVGLFENDSHAENGYTLFSVGNSTYLIDNCGLLINQWTSQFNPGLSVYLLENGNLLRPARVNGDFNGGGIGGRIELFNWEGDLLWNANYATENYHQHHDVAPLPNGNFLLIAWEKFSPVEAINAGRDPALTSNAGVWPDKVVEIEMEGTDQINVVWEWRAWDHLIQDFDSSKANYGVVADHPELIDFNFAASAGNAGPAGGGGSDWMHCNGINYNPELDQIVLSSRHLSEIYVIDHSTTTEEAAGHTGGNSGKGGDILYRYGNPQAYDRGTAIDRKFYKQHDVQWVPAGYPNEGKLTVFNNGNGRAGGNYSSIDMIDPPVDAVGNYTLNGSAAYGPADLFWTYEADPPESFFSTNISGAQALPNGNILICDGNAPRFFEVDSDLEVRWDYIQPLLSNGTPIAQGSTQQSADVFRATRFSDDYPAFDGKDLTPGNPLEADPLPFNCDYFDGPVSTADFAKIDLNIFPNPATGQVMISWEGDETLQVAVYNVVGKKIDSFLAQGGLTDIDTSDWANGTYFMQVEGYGVSKLVIFN